MNGAKCTTPDCPQTSRPDSPRCRDCQARFIVGQPARPERRGPLPRWAK
jgi:hypothetical protein